MPDHRPRGFTLIEMIATLVLVGILSAVIMSRFLPTNTFGAAVARDQIIALARSGQQRALGRDDVSLTLQPSGTELQISLDDDGGQLRSVSIDAGDFSLSGDVNQLDSCESTPGGYAITASSPMVVEFAWPGDLEQGGVVGSPGYPQNVSTGMRICLNNQRLLSVCISAAGFAYAGDCDA